MVGLCICYRYFLYNLLIILHICIAFVSGEQPVTIVRVTFYDDRYVLKKTTLSAYKFLFLNTYLIFFLSTIGNERICMQVEFSWYLTVP